MTSYGDWERHLYRAITGNRLSARTYNLDNALKEVGRHGGDKPWEAVGASRETWRRWHLGPDAHLASRPGPKHGPALLKFLRRARLSKAREQAIRNSIGIHIQATDEYDNQEQRDLGSQTLGWDYGANGRILDAYLNHGIGQAAQLAIASIGSGHFAEWMGDAADGSSQSYTINSIDLTKDHSGRTRGRRRR